MKSAEFEHLSGFLDGSDIGLGWLSGVSRLANVSAVSTRAHSHPHAELIFCLKGEFTYAIDQVGERTLGAGSGILIPAGTAHALQNDIDTPGERLGLHLLAWMRPKPDFAIFSSADYQTLKTRIQARGVASFRLTKGVMEHVRQLSDLVGVGKKLPSTHRAYIRILACSILYDVAEATTKATEPLRPELIESAADYLREHLSEGIDVDDVVRHVGYGRARFFVLFRERFHLTPIQYLTRLRIETACMLLKTTDLSIREIAAHVGIHDPSYFAVLFRRQTAISPVLWKQRQSFTRQRGLHAGFHAEEKQTDCEQHEEGENIRDQKKVLAQPIDGR